ncbi:MAG: hypothetical protein RIC55_22135 [Pirellulaceae bacterium]
MRTTILGAMALLLTCTPMISAEEADDRLDVGDYIPSYASTKCGGVDDGVAVGKTTCYTCRSGPEPIFYIFAARRNAALAKLTKEIDALVLAKQKKNAAAVINFLGDPEDETLRKEVVQFGDKNALKNVALTITADGSKFDLGGKDEVTVILFEKGVVRLRNSATAGRLDDDTVESIIRRSKALLN